MLATCYDPSAGPLRVYLTMQARHRAVDLRLPLAKLETVLDRQLPESP